MGAYKVTSLEKVSLCPILSLEPATYQVLHTFVEFNLILSQMFSQKENNSLPHVRGVLGMVKEMMLTVCPGGSLIKCEGRWGALPPSHLVFYKNLHTFIRSRSRPTSFLQSRGEEQWGRGEHRCHHRKKLRCTAKKARGDRDGREQPPHALCARSCLDSAQGRWHLCRSLKDKYQQPHFSHSGPNPQDVPNILPPPAPPWLPGGDTGLKACIVFSVKKAQTIQCQEERAQLPVGCWQNLQGALPTSQRQQRKGKEPGLWGLEQEGDLFFVRSASPCYPHHPEARNYERWLLLGPHPGPTLLRRGLQQTAWLWPASRSSPTSRSIPCLQLFPIRLGNGSENN